MDPSFLLIIGNQSKTKKTCYINLHFVIVYFSTASLQQWRGISSKGIKCISINPVNNNYFAVSSSDA